MRGKGEGGEGAVCGRRGQEPGWRRRRAPLPSLEPSTPVAHVWTQGRGTRSCRGVGKALGL